MRRTELCGCGSGVHENFVGHGVGKTLRQAGCAEGVLRGRGPLLPCPAAWNRERRRSAWRPYTGRKHRQTDRRPRLAWGDDLFPGGYFRPGHVAAAAEGLAHGGNAIIGAVERGDGGFLGYGADVGRGLASNLAEHLDQGRIRQRVADAPAGHGEAFGQSVYDGDVFGEALPPCGKSGGSGRSVDELVVDFIGNDEDIVPDSHSTMAAHSASV